MARAHDLHGQLAHTLELLLVIVQLARDAMLSPSSLSLSLTLSLPFPTHQDKNTA